MAENFSFETNPIAHSIYHSSFNVFFLQGLDSDSMMRIMIGIIKSGAWGCFDEFNRLDQTTLSQISLQISIIQHALRNNHDMVTLLGRQVHLLSLWGIILQLNLTRWLAWNLSFICPGFIEQRCWHLHYSESSWQRLWWQAETPGKFEAVIQASFDVQARRCRNHPSPATLWRVHQGRWNQPENRHVVRTVDVGIYFSKAYSSFPFVNYY